MEKRKAQTSLEFLIVLVAFFSVLMLFVPMIAKIHHSGILALEKKKATAFSQELLQTLDEFSLLANGSKKQLKVNASLKWEIEFTSGELLLEIFSKELNKSISLNETLPVQTSSLQFSCEGECLLEIEKQNNEIQIIILQY